MKKIIIIVMVITLIISFSLMTAAETCSRTINITLPSPAQGNPDVNIELPDESQQEAFENPIRVAGNFN